MCGIIFLGDEFMNKIREIMKKRGLTQEDLSEMTGIDQSTLSKIINEKKAITLDTAKKISSALGFSIEYIWPS